MSKIKINKARKPTEEETFYIQWGRDSLKQNLVFANEVLRQLVALDSVLLGGVILLLDAEMISYPYKFGAIGSLLLSLIMSLIGILPYEKEVDLRKPKEIKEHKLESLKKKRWYLWASGSSLVLAFVIAIMGIIIKKWI